MNVPHTCHSLTPSHVTQRPRASWLSVLSSVFALLLMACAQAGLGVVPLAGAHGLPAEGGATRCPAASVTGGPGCNDGPVVLSPSQRAILAKKTALAKEFTQVRAGMLPLAIFQRDAAAFLKQYGGPSASSQPSISPKTCIGDCLPPSASVNLVQQPQTQYFYCGPATASEILKERGVTASQPTVASSSYLNTTIYGTNWSNNDGSSPMAKTLNALTHSSFYVAVNSPSTSTLEADVMADIYTGWAVAAGVYEDSNTPHLAGHPTGTVIQHWIALKGYASSGASITYADSVYMASSVDFYKSVTSPYSSISASNLQTLVQPYGIVE